MLFHSHEFLFFFLLVFPLHWMVKNARLRHWILLLASYWFYMAWDARFGALMLFITTLDYTIGLALGRPDLSQSARRWLIRFSLASNLGALGIFKYFNFFQGSLESLLGAQWRHLDIVLPVGISFYTFQSLSYTIDIYRRQMSPERSFVRFALFVAFFPQLIAGPIIRAADFIPQLQTPKTWRWDLLHQGLVLFLFGLAKKVMVADNLSTIVDPVFREPDLYSGLGCYFAAVCFAFQIYCDFSGYSDMACGLALCFGYRLMENFSMPYATSNPSDFWRCWNISLSTWLRDYLYVSLGGNRGTKARTATNLMLTMFLGGLWHGANWTFIWWGIYHGCYLSVYHLLRDRLSRLSSHAWIGWMGILVNFHLFLVSWILFRADSLSIANQMLLNIAGLGHGNVILFEPRIIQLLLLVGVCHFLGMRYGCETLWKKWFEAVPSPVAGVAYAVAIVVILVLAPDTTDPFIYFQF